jgi:hypothetical protein
MGSHSEPQHVAILTQALLTADPTWYLSIEGEIRYSDYVGDPRRCDLRITTPLGSVLVEVKLLWQSSDQASLAQSVNALCLSGSGDRICRRPGSTQEVPSQLVFPVSISTTERNAL